MSLQQAGLMAPLRLFLDPEKAKIIGKAKEKSTVIKNEKKKVPLLWL